MRYYSCYIPKERKPITEWMQSLPTVRDLKAAEEADEIYNSKKI